MSFAKNAVHKKSSLKIHSNKKGDTFGASPAPEPSEDAMFNEQSNKPRRLSFSKRQKLFQPDPFKKPAVIVNVDSPFAVKNRLLSVMGTNKVKIMDRKYMKEYYNRLSNIENNRFEKRKLRREDFEKGRLNSLVIAGELEPDEQMLSHPVVRVNQTLRRLDAVNRYFFEMGTSYDKMPPITPVEPLSTDPSGSIFKTYPTHRKHKRIYYDDDAEEYECANESSETMLEEDENEEEEDEEEEDEEEEETVTIYTREDNAIENMEIEPKITNSNEPSVEQEALDSKTVRSPVTNEQSPNSNVEPAKETRVDSIDSVLDADIFFTESLRNISLDFSQDISVDEKTLREFSAIVRSANYKDSFVKHFESVEMDQAKIFQLANKIIKLFERKLKVAEDKLKNVKVGDFYAKGTL